MSVITYRYDASPFSVKVDYLLLLKGIPHNKVNVKSFLPRPEITDFLGLGYRRIPIVAIGNDIYCDTSLIANALEQRFPPAQGYGSIYPLRKGGGSDAGLIQTYKVGDTLFPMGAAFLPWDKFPEQFLKDRASFNNLPSISPNSLISGRDRNLSAFSAHLKVTEDQLCDGREWLFDTVSPSLADISLFFVLSWLKELKGTDSLFDENKIPRVIKWMYRLAEHLEILKKNSSVSKITGEAAAKAIASGPPEPSSLLGFDVIEGARLRCKEGDIVHISPDDTGRAFPTIGKLVGLNQEQFVVETTSSYGTFKCHFPRIGFSIRTPKNKL